MAENKVLTESMGVVGIENASMNAVEQLNILLGEKSGTSYQLSYSGLIANDAGVQNEISQITEKVDWNEGIRYATKQDKDSTRNRCVYLVASVVKSLAFVLAKRSEAHNERLAARIFKGLYSSKDTNQFKKAADDFYEAVVSAAELNTKSRLNVAVEDDYAASAEAISTWSKLRPKVMKISSIVKDILAAAGLSVGVNVSIDEFNTAVRWLFTYDMVRFYLHGKEDTEQSWYEPNASEYRMITNKLDHMADDSEARYSGTSNDEDELLSSTSDIPEPVDMKHRGDRQIVKDMQNLGTDDMNQMTVVNEQSNATCEYYIPIFAVNGLIGFEEKYGDEMKRLCSSLLSSVGAGDLSGLDYPTFCERANEFFAKQATNTSAALKTREAIVDRLMELYDTETDKKSKQKTVLTTATHELCKVIYGKHLTSFDSKHIDGAKRLAKAFLNKVVYKGPAENFGSISGSSLRSGSIQSNRLAQPVSAFGEESRNNRQTTYGLTSNGYNASKCFTIEDGNLVVQFDQPDGSGVKVVDVIPVNDIRNVYDTYVSSSLLPVNGDWVVMKGIRVYSELRNGNMDDSVATSDLTNVLSNRLSRTFSKTRVGGKETAVRYLTRPDFVRQMTKYKFISDEDADNIDAKMAIAEKVYNAGKNPEENARIGDRLTKLRHICDLFTTGLTKFAGSITSTKVGLQKKDVVGYLSQTIAPSLVKLVSAKEDCLDSLIIEYIKYMSPGYVDSSVADLYSCMSNISKAFKTLKEINVSDSMTPSDCVQLFNAINNYIFQMTTRFAAIPESNEKSAVTQLNIAMRPREFDQISDAIKGISDAATTGNTSAIVSQKAKLLITCRQLLIQPEGAFAKFETAKNTLFEQILNAGKQDPNIGSDRNKWISKETLTNLKECLMPSVEYINRENITLADVNFLYKLIALTMSGDLRSNYEYVKKLRVNQIVKPIQILGTMRSAVGLATQEEKANVDDTANQIDVSIGRAGDPEMSEIDPMGSDNLLNRAHSMRQLENDEEVTSASGEDDINELNDILPNMNSVLNRFKQFKESKDELADIKETVLRSVIPLATEYNMGQKDIDPSDPESVLDAIQSNPYIPHKDKMYEYAKSSFGEYYACEMAVKSNYAILNEYAKTWPSMESVIHALCNNMITPDDVSNMLDSMSTASSIIQNLVKYKDLVTAKQSRNPNIDPDEISRRMYAFTESDDASIAQLIMVLGNYVCNAHDDTQDELIDSIGNIQSIIEQYSGNPMSVKAANIVMSRLEEVHGNDEDDFVSAVIKLADRLGGFLRSRTSNSVRSDLEKFSTIGSPANHSADYGKATDAFARSQIRGRLGDSEMHQAIASVNKKEANLRGKVFVDLLVNDMEENVELAKYAYTLGKALDAFKRTVDDERMSASSLEKRPFQAIIDSFKNVKLYGEIGENDLQRELISAIIDDERNGDKQYGTVKSVLNAAMTGGSILSYGQMHSNVIGEKENILHDTKSVTVSFDKDGNQSASGVGTALSNDEIGVLATGGDNYRFTGDVIGLVKAVRRSVFNTLIKGLGSVDFYGKATATREGALIKDAIESLYRLCNDLDTPLSSIILAHSSIGHMGGRKVLMKYASDILKSEGDLDFDTAAMVSGEPNVFPQKYSSESSGADLEWVDQVSDLLGQIPEGMTTAEVRDGIDQYCSTEKARREMMDDPNQRVLFDILERLQSVDTPSGIPIGYYGDDKPKLCKALNNVFNLVLNGDMDSAKYYIDKVTDRAVIIDPKTKEPLDAVTMAPVIDPTTKKPIDMDRLQPRKLTWAERARIIRSRSHDAIERGGNMVGLYGSHKFHAPSEVARSRIAHLRMNPFYSVDISSASNGELKDLIKELTKSGYIVKDGISTIVLKYPKMALDRYLFSYIAMIALNMHDRDKLPYDCAMDTALMCYLGKVRYPRYKDLLTSVSPYMNEDWSETEKSIDSLVSAKHLNGLVQTSLGWFTDEAYLAICIYASKNSPSDLLAGVKQCVAELTDGGVRDYDINNVTRKPIAKSNADDDEGDDADEEDILDTESDDDIEPDEAPTIVPATETKPKAKPKAKTKAKTKVNAKPDDDVDPSIQDFLSNFDQYMTKRPRKGNGQGKKTGKETAKVANADNSDIDLDNFSEDSLMNIDF